MTRLYGLLVCPSCGESPEPGGMRCPGCGRLVAAAGGGLDLLDDAAREAADRFAASYTALRRLEGWVGPNGVEDPEGGEPRLWRTRLESVSEASAAITTQMTGGGRPVVTDIGSGGGWATRYLQGADVIAFDLLDVKTPLGVLHVRGDMRRLPVRNGTVDAALYAASLHYAPIQDSVREAARVLRPGGLVVAVDSPMYRDSSAQERAEARSTKYYAEAGFPELSDHYHPIAVTSLRTALADAGFEVARFDAGRTAQRWWERLGQARQASFLVARLDRRYA